MKRGWCDVRRNDPDYLKAKELWVHGMSAKRIAYECGTSVAALTGQMQRHREDFPIRKSQTTLTDEQRAEVVRMHESGMTYRQIADVFGVHHNTIGKIVHGR